MEAQAAGVECCEGDWRCRLAKGDMRGIRGENFTFLMDGTTTQTHSTLDHSSSLHHGTERRLSLAKSSSDLHVEIFDDEKHKDIETVAEQTPPDLDQDEVKRILRKIDLRLLPVLTALYLMSFLDRSNSQL